MPGKPKPRHSVTQPLDKPYRFIPLTQDQTAIIDTSDFAILNERLWYAAWDKSHGRFYATAIFGNDRKGHLIQIAMHRFIMAAYPNEEIDHKNGDTLDNRRCNLRKSTTLQNSRNRRRSKNNTSGFKGVHRHPRLGWRARICVNRKRLHVGYFATAEEAAHAYDEAAKKYHGEFAKLNF